MISVFFLNQKGNILIMTAIFMPVALGLLALTINMGTIHYVKSGYTAIGNTATSSGLSLLGDEMADIVSAKMSGPDPYTPVSSDVWDNLTDADRDFLTSDPAIIADIENEIENYLYKNSTAGAVMRNDFVIKDIEVEYPYDYNLSDEFVKAHLEFKVATPISLIESTDNEDILIKAEARLKIK